uniref:Ubiquitin-like domain-containing protein n=1 Tax=Sus scrofa TaxID=9823 RepID=A0A8D1NBC2_PIG
MQISDRAQELRPLEVTSQETVSQIKALEGIALEDQVLLLAGTPLEDEGILGQCEVEALSTLEVAGCMLGGKVHGSLAMFPSSEVSLPRWPNMRKRRRSAGPRDNAIQPALCQRCVHLRQEEGTQCQLLGPL